MCIVQTCPWRLQMLEKAMYRVVFNEMPSLEEHSVPRM
jgi:hypothetical protein